MRLVWDPSAWGDYKYWQTADRRVLKRINTLIDACLRDPFAGVGKPERLKSWACVCFRCSCIRRPRFCRLSSTAGHTVGGC